MIAALAVLALVVDHPALGIDLDLADREVALKVRGVVPGIPETELQRTEQGQPGRGVPVVGDRRPPDLEGLAQGDEVGDLGLDPGSPRADDRVPEPVTAAIALQLRLRGLPGRRPEVPAVPVP
jgi:hypothetical protein